MSNLRIEKFNLKPNVDSVLSLPEQDGIGYKNNTYYRRKIQDM
jgi:hypothetical protein